MSKLIQLNNLNNYANNLIINEFTKLIKETKEVIDYYLPYNESKGSKRSKVSKENKENISNEDKYVNQLIFKLNAFEISLEKIKKYNFVINNGNQLKKIKGIGKGTIERINYILKNGYLEKEYPILSEIYKEKLQKEQLEPPEKQEKVKSLTLIKTETENEIKTEIKTENEQPQELKIEQSEQSEELKIEQPKIEQSEITENIKDLEIEKDILGGCLSSTFNTLNNLKGLFCSFYNDIYVNFNEELNISSKED